MVRVLIVDDSAFARKVVREILVAAGFEVVGTARDGLEALEKIAELKPDVVTLDLVMPNLDGLGLLAALPAQGAPRVVVVSMAGEETALGMAALQAGAVEVVNKPTALATERLREISDELVRAVGAAAIARQPESVPPARAAAPPTVWRARTRRVVVIGASTGGPQALRRLVGALPQGFPVPVAIVLHLPPGYTEAFARRLDEESEVEVLEASENLELTAGRVVVARAGMHLKLRRDGGAVRAHLDSAPADVPHRPSVDALFRSAAEVYGAGVLGVVLTGMGNDGLEGAQAIHAAGGELLTEAESSCVVYGMPRSVDEAGLSSAKAPISEMAQTILQRL
jgi:two-component system chemotaxis response regulator CheB